MTVSVNILLGIIAGFFSGSLIYLYSYHREKARRIIEYAKSTEERANMIREEIKLCSNSKSILKITKLVNQRIYRQFAGDIIDKKSESVTLQKAIAQCNLVISGIDRICEEQNGFILNDVAERELMQKDHELNEALIKITNAISDYDVQEDRNVARWHNRITLLLIITGSIIALVFLFELLQIILCA